MNGLPGRDDLRLEATDFGPIAEAHVDLRPLTVFIGPSNTGKSYLAILIYALHRCFSGDPGFAGWPMSRRFRTPRRRMGEDRLHENRDAIGQLARIFSDKIKSGNDDPVILPATVTEWIRLAFEAQGSNIGREIARCFAVDRIGTLVREGQKKGARIVMRGRIRRSPSEFEHNLTLQASEANIQTKIQQEMSLQVDASSIAEFPIVHVAETLSVESETDVPEHYAKMLLNVLFDLALPSIAGPLRLPAFYLPADRTGVMHAHSVVVSALIESAATFGIRPPARPPMLSGVLADFLEQLIAIDVSAIDISRPRRRSRNDFGASIEEAILHGTVEVEHTPPAGHPRFMYRPVGWGEKRQLPLMNASSMVSELAPVVLYLRHLVGPDNVLIVEEPESHLHPAMQVEFTRQLAALVRGGIRVIVTTHSEWLLEALANIVRRSELPDDGAPALRPDEVGAWLFKDQRNGSVVSEIGLDDSGVYPSGFDDVAAALHNEWADTASRIENAR